MVIVQNLFYKTILSSVSFTLQQGTCTALIGPSGAGKTTLLECLVQLKKSFTGTILLNNQKSTHLSLKQRAQTVGFVFQQFNLFPHLSVLENCIQPLCVTQGVSRATASEKAQRILSYFEINTYKDTFPSQLSGGQQQRVALARTLALEPALVCLDEPTSALDPANSNLLTVFLTDLAKKGSTILFSSQDTSFIKNTAQELLLLEKGTIIEKTDLQNYEKNTKINQFLNYSERLA